MVSGEVPAAIASGNDSISAAPFLPWRRSNVVRAISDWIALRIFSRQLRAAVVLIVMSGSALANFGDCIVDGALTLF